MNGLTSFSYEATGGFNFTFGTTLSCTGSMVFNSISFTFFNYRTRICPASFPYFFDGNGMCYNFCDPYFYTNTAIKACIPCSFTCYTCSPSNPSICLSCSMSLDYRVLVNGICVCANGYYDQPPYRFCWSCNNTCLTCVNDTGCTSCNPTRTLVGDQCPCAIGYIDNNTTNCSPCSVYIPGCT